VKNHSARSWEIHAGALNFPNEAEPGRVIVSTRDAILHENYDGFTLDNDIAIVKLSESVSGTSENLFLL
jgi:Trypsin